MNTPRLLILLFFVCFSIGACNNGRQVPDHSFVNQLGDTISLYDLRGAPYVANFFFTSCPGICITLSSQMEKVQAAFPDPDKVKLISISVDANRDSISVLKAYAEAHNARNDQWYFLRGDSKNVKHLAQKGFNLINEQEAAKSDFVHSEKLMLVDKYGTLKGYYNGLDTADVNRLIRDIKALQ